MGEPYENGVGVRKLGTTKEKRLMIEPATDATTYVRQRARGAYIASICQPEASFALATAAQSASSQKEEVARLNKCLQWQKTNIDRGIKYVRLDTQKLKLYTMVDASFANNADLSSQIGYVIILGNQAEPQKRRGRPLGSKNKSKAVVQPVAREALLTERERSDMELAMKLRAEGKIRTPGAPFEASTTKEIDALIDRGVFKFEPHGT